LETLLRQGGMGVQKCFSTTFVFSDEGGNPRTPTVSRILSSIFEACRSHSKPNERPHERHLFRSMASNNSSKEKGPGRGRSELMALHVFLVQPAEHPSIPSAVLIRSDNDTEAFVDRDLSRRFPSLQWWYAECSGPD